MLIISNNNKIMRIRPGNGHYDCLNECQEQNKHPLQCKDPSRATDLLWLTPKTQPPVRNKYQRGKEKSHITPKITRNHKGNFLLQNNFSFLIIVLSFVHSTYMKPPKSSYLPSMTLLLSFTVKFLSALHPFFPKKKKKKKKTNQIQSFYGPCIQVRYNFCDYHAKGYAMAH